MRKEVKIGIFALAMLLLLYWGINFIKGTDLVRGSRTYYAQYEQVAGVQISAPIVVQGYKVGVVQAMHFDPQKSKKITLELSVKSRFHIPADSRARIFSDGLLGGKAIEIQLGSSPEMLQQHDTIASDIETSELENLQQHAERVIDRLTLALDGINALLESNAASLTTTLSNVADISTTLNSVVSREAAHVHAILADVNALTASLSASAPKIESTLENIEAVSDTLRQARIGSLVGNLSSSLAELNATLTHLNAGNGTAGKLLTDEQLYHSLAEASKNLSALLEDLKANPKRYVHFSLF